MKSAGPRSGPFLKSARKRAFFFKYLVYAEQEYRVERANQLGYHRDMKGGKK